jgi:hypothetical protein
MMGGVIFIESGCSRSVAKCRWLKLAQFVVLTAEGANTMAKGISQATGVAMLAVVVLFAKGVDANEPSSSQGFDGDRASTTTSDSAERSLAIKKDQGGTERVSAKPSSSFSVLGASFDIGFPDGIIAGLAIRPWNWFRLSAGAGTNAISFGVRGGVTIVPFAVGPSFIVEGGHYFEGNANSTVSAMTSGSNEGNRLADKVGYQYANLHLGLELGKEFTFFVHGGMSYIHTTLHNVNEEFGGASDNNEGGKTVLVFNGDPLLSAWVPSLKLGFIIYLV